MFAALSADFTIREIGAHRFTGRQRRDRLNTILDKSGSQSISFVLIRVDSWYSWLRKYATLEGTMNPGANRAASRVAFRHFPPSNEEDQR
jgi:hypothetical protein